ncbi:DNA excision repair protein ERCC-6-like 2 isoform X2 [Dunckerocampus dactyliophorus]|uniref:DNA excision repair protein ERCC-6-like 2 isoform X2 n=1 Tax=Dunckerocampus dactyliophorus TaxID=161453 RepID=UPI002405FCC6|nr:DNA excision repair protein ERCC-6-like 2 isoform X2 [Dunckerocampus dactyliophorus]
MEATSEEEASCQNSSPSHIDHTTAMMVFTEGHNGMNEQEDNKEEEAAPLTEDTRADLKLFNREKPLFSGGAEHSGSCFPLKLCDLGEDSVPYTINRYLRDYQREGIRFIYSNYIRSRGCILGDDMGLGKTVQVIGFLGAVLHKKGTWEDIENNKPHFLQTQTPSKQMRPNKVFLIVAPLSVLYNWKDELDTWGHFQYVVVHGLRKQEELARIKKGRVEIALTTYETLRLCMDQVNDIDWSAVFVDEAHKIKNPNSQITQAMKGLKCQVRIGLTGTILQNNLEELWCVMDWAVPGCLGSLGHFKNKMSDPIEQGQRHSATKRALATARKTISDLVRKIAHFFLRRTKALISDQLPKKDDRVVYCSLTDFQRTVYQTVLDTEDVKLLLRSSEKCDCQSGYTRRRCCYKTNLEGVPTKGLYFSYLTILRKVASHVALLQSTAGTSKKQEKYVSAICQKVFQKFPDFVRRCKDEAFAALSDPTYSGKMKVLQKLLKYYLQRKDKVLLFSLSTKLLDVLESYCMAEGLDYSRLDGTTKSKERVHIVKDFNSSPHVNLCLVSTMAGGLGLNFVGANVVILFDPTWNPANDLQAIDRAYRIGQCRDVTVLRLISLGTVEEITYLRQIYKQQLQSSVVGMESARRYFEAVQGHDIHKGELFGINNLFRLQTQGTCLTRKILERTGQVEAGVMTTSTHTTVEMEDMQRVSDSGDVSMESMDASRIPRGALDFSSGSDEEEEEWGGPSRKDDTWSREPSAGPGPTSLLQHGFSKLLQRIKAVPESGEGDSSSGGEENDSSDSSIDCNSNIENKGCLPTVKSCKTNLEASERRSSLVEKKDKMPAIPKSHHFDEYSDESDDLDMETITKSEKDTMDRGGDNRKRHTSMRDKTRGTGFSEDIETFTSSEDEHTGGRHTKTTPPDKAKATPSMCGQIGRSTERQVAVSNGVLFTNLKSQTSPASKGTIDTVLGGVQEVAYAHSNQRVVGGSKAEDLITRAALRDVFERQMYSQLPANEFLTPCEEMLPPSPADRQPRLAPPQQLPEPRPVTFTKKNIQHTSHTTVILGETPLAVRRQQLQEMASKFSFPSAHQFAAEILTSDSPQRIAWLRRYYTDMSHPEVDSFITSDFLPADITPSTSVGHHPLPKNCATRALQKVARSTSNQTCSEPEKKKRRKSQKNVQEPPSDVPTVDTEQQVEAVCKSRGHKRTKKTSVSACGAFRAVGGLGGDQDSSSGSLESLESASKTIDRAEEQTEHSQERTSCRRSILTELLGDTSILDDLLKPKSRSTQHRGSPPKPSPSLSSTGLAASPPPRHTINPHSHDSLSSQQSRGSRKDFWDILNEGNEESINRLTDLEEVQRVCVSTTIAARAHSVEESKSLWKTNDKFLWKR